MLDHYRSLLGSPDTRRLILSAFVGRLPYGMLGFAYLLIVRESGGAFADVGLVLGAYSLAIAPSSPVLGRLVDRLGPAPVLIATAFVEAAAVLGFVLSATAGAGIALLAVIAALSGAAHPPLSPAIRGVWSQRFAGAELEAASALEAIALELGFVIGPTLAAAIAALVSAEAAALVSAALSFGGSVTFATAPTLGAWTGGERPGSLLGPLRAPGILVIVISVAITAIAEGGVLEIALPAFADERGSIESAGILFTLFSIGSLIGGLAYGARTWRSEPRLRLLALTALLAVGTVPLAFADSMPAMAVLVTLCGLALAPLTAVTFTMIGELAPPGAVAEAYAWEIGAFLLGASLGAVWAGAVVEDAGTTTAFLLGSAVIAAGAVVVLAGYRSLRTAAEPSPLAPMTGARGAEDRA